MRRYLLLIALAACVASAQTANTTITGTITSPSGPNPSGTATVSWSQYMNDTNPRQKVPAGQRVFNITLGVVSISLFPNLAALPSGGCYQIDYRLAGQSSRRFWTVPVSSAPVNINLVESNIPCTPSTGSSVAPAQIVAGSPGVTQVLTSSTTGFVSWVTGSGSGGTPGGSNGQLQYNNLGAFGGFTVGGDCVLNNPSFICTKTNGVSFAPSATIDTTNAGNIMAGILLPARGGTGAAAFSVGSIPFIGSGGVYQQDNTDLFWDSINGRLGLGTATPSYRMDVFGAGRIFGDGGSSGAGQLLLTNPNNTQTWVLASQGNTGNRVFNIYDITNGQSIVVLEPGSGNDSLHVNANGLGVRRATPIYSLDVGGGPGGTGRFYDDRASIGITNVVLKAGAGQAANDLLNFYDNSGNLGGGIGTGTVYVYDTGTFRAELEANVGVAINSTGRLVFSSTTQAFGTADTGIGRNAAGVLEVNNGTLGTLRDATLRNLTSSTLITGVAATMSGLTTTGTLKLSGLIGGGPQCLTVDNGGNVSGTGSACGSGGSSGALSGLTAATGANTIANGDFAQVWNWTLTTSSKSAFTFGEGTASAAAGTPILVYIKTLATSTVNPFQVTAGGTANGVRVNTSGVLSKIGSGQINADHYNGNAVVAVVDGGTGLATYSSGGVICATASTTLASSSALTANGVVIGGGVGACPSSISAAAGGTLLQGVAASMPAFTATPTLGITGSVLGTITFSGNTSGAVTIAPQAAAGTYNFNLPTTAGSAGQVLLSGGGGSSPMTWASAATIPVWQLAGSTFATENTFNFVAGTGITITGSNPSGKGQGQFDVDTAVILSKATAQSGSELLVTTTSFSPTVYTGTMSPTLTTYTNGMVVNWKVSTACTGGTATTINLDALGAKSLKQSDGTTDPTSGQCTNGKLVPMWYDGTLFRII